MFSSNLSGIYNPFLQAGLSGKRIGLLKFNLCNLYVLEAVGREKQLLTILDILSHHFIECKIEYLVDLDDGSNYFRVKPCDLNCEFYIKSTNDNLILEHPHPAILNINNIGLYIAHYILCGNCEFCVKGG